MITILNSPDINKPYALAVNDDMSNVMPIFRKSQKFMKPAHAYSIAMPVKDLRMAIGITLNTSAT